MIAEYESGREIALATASNTIYAKQVADYLGCFSYVFATNEDVNLKGIKKLNAIVNAFGEQGFDYVGDSKSDLKIIPHTKKTFIVNAKQFKKSTAMNNSNVELAFEYKENSIHTFFKAIRIHQWLKNILLFVPVFTSHNWFNLPMILQCTIGFFALSMCASSTYILNDLLDIQSDRAHPKKGSRPFASGNLSILTGATWMFILLTIGLTSAALLDSVFFNVVLIYLVITLTYSLYIKNVVLMDVISLAMLYTVRVIAGALLIHVQLSFWLFAFSIFLFFSLALIKRCTELQMLKAVGKNNADGRDYYYEDLETLRSMGVGSGFLSIVVFSLYMNSIDVLSLYSQTKVLWLICPVLLFWISRLWIKTGRGEMHDDPVVYAIKDRVSILILGIVVGLVVVATYA
jgi:4-hydroxybenzoate polyprenyltransferase